MTKINRGLVMFLILVIFMIGLHFLDTHILVQHEGNEAEIAYSSHHPAPDFTVCDSDGTDIRLANSYPKPAVVYFWASWDEVSRNLLPVFQELYLEYGDSIQFVMVDLTDGTRETRETAEAYLSEKGYDFPVYYDIYGSAKAAYGARSIPAVYFINSSFELIARANGSMTEELLEKGLMMALDPETSPAE